MREVATEEDRLNPQFVAPIDLRLVDERRTGQAVRLPVLAGPSLGGDLAAVALPDLVEMGQGCRDPVDPDLGQLESQVGVAIEYPAEHHLPHWLT